MNSFLKKYVIIFFLFPIILLYANIVVFGDESLMKDVFFDKKTECYKWKNGNNAIYGLWVIPSIYFEGFIKLFSNKPIGSESYYMIVDKSETKGKIIFLNGEKIGYIFDFNITRDSTEDFHFTVNSRSIYMKATTVSPVKKYVLIMTYDKDKFKSLMTKEEYTAEYYRYLNPPYKETDSLEELEKKCIANGIATNKRDSD